MLEAYIGSIVLWSLSWAPEGWLFCNGQLLSSASNGGYFSLYTLIGNSYGGTFGTNFAVPDLRSRVPIGVFSKNQSPNFSLTPVPLGQSGGTENTQLLEHKHTAQLNNPTINVYSQIAVSSKQATQAAATTNSTIATPMVSDGGANPTLTPAFGYNNETPDTRISGLYVSANPIGGSVAVNNAGTAFTGNYLNMQPFLGLNYIICYQGIFPERPNS
jgi:microcystin-dependent protein